MTARCTFDQNIRRCIVKPALPAVASRRSGTPVGGAESTWRPGGLQAGRLASGGPAQATKLADIHTVGGGGTPTMAPELIRARTRARPGSHRAVRVTKPRAPSLPSCLHRA